MSSMVEQFAVERLERLINQALALDPGSQRALAQLSGSILGIHSTFPPLSLAAAFLPGGEVHLSATVPEDATTVLTGSPVTLAMLAAKGADSTTLANSGVRLEGDHNLLSSLAAILHDLEIDWEQALAELIGDTPAHLAGNAVRSAARWQHSAFTRSVSGSGEYAREESGLALSNTEARDWFSGVRHLSADTDRLAARINKLRVALEREEH